MNKLRYKENLIKALKIAIGAVVAITIATIFGLENSFTAGTVTILSIQNTKKETLILAAKKLVAFLIAVLIAKLCFTFIGFNTLGYGVFLLVFAIACIFANMQENLVICIVLITHMFLKQNTGLAIIGNQLAIMIIGAAVGILLNLFMNNLKDVQDEITFIDDEISRLLQEVSNLLIHQITVEKVAKSVDDVKTYLDKAIVKAEQLNENFLMNDYSYYSRYLQFRQNQIAILVGFTTYAYKPGEVSEEEKIISEFVAEVADASRQCDDASGLIREAGTLLTKFRARDLPTTRAQFESRAILYGQLVDLENMLKLKRNFIHSLDDTQKAHYWKNCPFPTREKV